MTNLATFVATINPEGAVKDNIVVCRFNNETKEYWLAKARCSPWLTSAADNLDHIPDGTSVILVGMRANAVGLQVLCRARAVVDALHEPQPSARTHAGCSHTLCNSAPPTTGSSRGMSSSAKKGTTTCTSGGTRTTSR